MVLFSDFRGCIISSYPQSKPVSFKCKSNIVFHWHQDTCKPFSSEKNYNLVIVFFVPISKSTLTRAFKMRLSVNNAVIYRKKPHMVFGKWKRGVGCLFSTQKNGERFLASLMERERSSRTSLSRKIVLHQHM